MKISIITPVFNSSKTIRKNAFSVLMQSYKNFEHIIIDNLSFDNTLSIIRNLYRESGLSNNLRIISEKDEGISDAFNKGIKASKGDVIAILNGDDKFYHEDVLQQVVDAFNQNPQASIVYGDIFFKDLKYGSNVRRPLENKPLNIIHFNHMAFFVKKDFYEKVGLYDQTFKIAMDTDIFLRASKLYNFDEEAVYIDIKPMSTMIAGGASWNNESKCIEECVRAYKKINEWNFPSKKEIFFRKIRSVVKHYLTETGFLGIIAYWRKRKWKK